MGPGQIFQTDTKYARNKMERRTIDFSRQPETYKHYPDANRIALPEPKPNDSMQLSQIITKRRSTRVYRNVPVSMTQLANLLWYSTGIREREGRFEFRTAPSAGALYPIETYIVANRVEGLASGVYHYNIPGHQLEELRTGEYGMQTAHAALEQDMCADAAVVFIWSAVFARSMWKYGERAFRYIYLDAGHIAENLALACVDEGLASCQIAALFDDEANNIVGIDGKEESVIYMTCAGYAEEPTL